MPTSIKERAGASTSASALCPQNHRTGHAEKYQRQGCGEKIGDLMRGTEIFKFLHLHRADEIMVTLFMQVNDHRWLIACSSVCKYWEKIIQENSLWRNQCTQLWSDKVSVPYCIQSLYDSGRSKEAFVASLRDSTRTFMMATELSAISFFFRFKRVAGKYWTEKDPFWNRNEPLRIRFGEDGVVTGFPWDNLEMKWHFVDEAGVCCSESGSYIRVAINGRCVPTFKISRHSNWGFILQNIWVVYLSFPIARLGDEPAISDSELDTVLEDERWGEAIDYNRGAPMPHEGE